MRKLLSLCFVAGLLAVSLATAAVEVVDDSGHTVSLEKPAVRIISLAPHVTELLFSAGAGSHIVGAVEYSDYPHQANRIPRVGASNQFDFERIAQLKPDLIVGWQSGNPAHLVARLRHMGFSLYLSEPQTIEDIPSNIERLAQLAGTTKEARQAVTGFRKKIATLRAQYSGQTPVTVFYEIWNGPLMTLGGRHIFSQLLNICGGRNIFSDVSALAPQVSREAVIARNPQVILASGMGEERPEWLDEWKQWKSLSAVKNDHLYFIHPDYLQRASLRLATGAEQLCSILESSRSH